MNLGGLGGSVREGSAHRTRRKSASDIRISTNSIKKSKTRNRKKESPIKAINAFSNTFNSNYERVLFDELPASSVRRREPTKVEKEKLDCKGTSGNQWLFLHKTKIRVRTIVKLFRANILRQKYIEVHFDDGSLAAKTVKALGLEQRHLRKLKKKFDNVDIDHSGIIDSKEFFRMLNEEKCAFTDSLFSFIDLDNSGTITFDEFVRVCATYCMFTREEILQFWFDCYDEDGSGAIDEDEFVELCKAVNNKSPMFPGNFSNALTMFDSNDDGLIDFKEFVELDKRFPLVLYPAFRLQGTMQKMTLGERAWTDIFENLQKTKKKGSGKQTKIGNRNKQNKPLQSIIYGAFFSHSTIARVHPPDPNLLQFEEIKQNDREMHRQRTIATASKMRRRRSTSSLELSSPV